MVARDRAVAVFPFGAIGNDYGLPQLSGSCYRLGKIPVQMRFSMPPFRAVVAAAVFACCFPALSLAQRIEITVPAATAPLHGHLVLVIAKKDRRNRACS